MAAFRRLRWIIHTRRHPSAVLLLVQLAGMLLYPFAEGMKGGRIAVGVFGIVVLLITIGLVRRTPGPTWISVGLALPAIALLALQALVGWEHLLWLSAALEAALYFYAAGSLIAYMLEDRRATTDELFAAGATFTLLAWAFAYVFVCLQVLQPGSFSAAVNAEQPRTWTELMFLSFAVLSSTGIGDVIPIRPLARAVCALEMFVGLVYLAGVVARLIGMTLQPKG